MTGGSNAWLTLLRDLSVKSALFLLAAWALTLAMRRASAAARHLVWLLTFAGLVALPLLSVTLPSRPVPVLPVASVAAVSVPIAAAPEAVPDRLPAPFVPAPSPSVRPMPPAPPARPPLLCLLWLLGVTLFLAPVILGLALAGRRIRRCSPVTDPAVLALAAEAARRLGVRRSVALRSSPSVSVPVTFGLMRPVILLPDGAASWPAERLRVALLHELAHVRRGDWAAWSAPCSGTAPWPGPPPGCFGPRPNAPATIWSFRRASPPPTTPSTCSPSPPPSPGPPALCPWLCRWPGVARWSRACALC